MITTFDYNQVFTVILFYTLIYNISLLLFLTLIVQLSNNSLTTTFYLYKLPQESFFTKIFLITLLSMAGVPPLLGFFSKVSIFVVLTNSNFFILFPIFFILLFNGLYFYLQNARLILTNASESDFSLLYITNSNVRFSSTTGLLSLLIVFVLITGPALIEDFLLVTSWIVS